MIYIDTRSEDIAYNLAAELYFATEKLPGEDAFFMWRVTPTLVIGKYQNALEEIDAAYAREHGISVARRLSGGGTVYLDRGGWQFAFVTDSAPGASGSSDSPGSNSCSDGAAIEFSRFVTPIVAALRQIGVNAELTGRNDIAVGGRKICGNAQYRIKNRTVHHGCMLFDTDIDELVRATTPKAYKIESKAVASVRERVVNVKDVLPPERAGMTAEQFRDEIVFRVAHRRYEITPQDRARIEALADERFRAERLLYTLAPKFEMEKVVRTAGGAFHIGLTVKNGKILSCGVSGDFFGAPDAAERIGDALTGADYTPSAVREILSRFDGLLFRADAEELTRGLFE
ncbi:MAG: lipoate--protein ligase [Clostridia bacterium]|nr:lipoate--protein ligase [Clostridia bacterium]